MVVSRVSKTARHFVLSTAPLLTWVLSTIRNASVETRFSMMYR